MDLQHLLCYPILIGWCFRSGIALKFVWSPVPTIWDPFRRLSWFFVFHDTCGYFICALVLDVRFCNKFRVLLVSGGGHECCYIVFGRYGTGLLKCSLFPVQCNFVRICCFSSTLDRYFVVLCLCPMLQTQ